MTVAASPGATGSDGRSSRAVRPPARWNDDSDVLYQRSEELRRLSQAVAELRDGRSNLVVVTGQRGVGRSALLRHALAEARAAGLPAALARCSPAEADLRFGVLSQLTVGLAGAGLRFPARPLWAEPVVASTAIPALCEEFVAVARHRPLLIAVDDTHWADHGSHEWLRAMEHRLHHAAMLLIQVRTAAPAEDAALDEWSAASGPPAATVIHLRPLREQEVGAVITSRFAGPVDGAFVAGACAATGGRPAVLHAVLDYFALADLPPVAKHLPVLTARAADVLGEHVAETILGVPSDARPLLRAMAVAGDSLDVDLVASLVSAPSVPTAQTLAMLTRLGLVTGIVEPRLASDLVVAQVLAGMDVGERQTLARGAAELGYRAAIAEDRLADLLLNAPPIGAGWAVDVLRRVAAQRRGAADDRAAGALLARALREEVSAEQRRQLLVDLSAAEVGYSPHTSDRRLQRVLLDTGPDGPSSALVRAADLLQSRGDAPAAYRAIATLCARRADWGAPTGSLAAIGWLAAIDSTIEPVLPVPAFPELTELTDRPGDPIRAGVTAWMMAIRGRRRSRVRELARAALRVAGPDWPFGPRIAACRALLCADDVAEAVIGLDEVVSDARRHGARAAAGLALVHRGSGELQRGNLDQATDDLAAARAELPSTSYDPRVLPEFVALDAIIHLARGSIEQAQQALATELPAGADEGVAWASLLFARAKVSMTLADPEEALTHVNECGRVLLAWRRTNPALLAWRSLAAAAHRACGNLDDARRFTRDTVRRAEVWGAPDTLGLAHLAAARVLSGVEAVAELERAVRALRDSTARVPYATAMVELVGAWLEAGERATARIVLAEAARAVAVVASTGLTDRMRFYAASLSADPPPAPAGTRPRLQAEEERIAALAAGGLSNADIARVLSLSTRTVELRLTGIYRKLAVASRGELVPLFWRHVVGD